MSGKAKKQLKAKKALISKKLANKLYWRMLGKGAYGNFDGMPLGSRIYGGRGGFWDWIKDRVKFVPRAIGAAHGMMTGGLPGAKTGWEAGAELSKNIGWGAYGRRPTRGRGANMIDYVGSPVLANKSILEASPVPAMHSGDESVSLHKIEYLGDVYTSTTAGAFNNQVFEFNPGVFLYWGKKFAHLFQQWKLEGATVHFRTRSSSYTSTTTLGTVMMAMDYNPHNAAFTTKQEMQQCAGSVACAIDQNCTLGIEAAQGKSSPLVKYVRIGALPTGEDQHLYDLGNLQIATCGCAANVNIGEIYISYHMTFFKPIAKFGYDLDCARYRCAGTMDATHNLGTTTPTKIFDNIGIYTNIGPSYTNPEIYFPAGTSGVFRIEYMVVGTSAAVGAAMLPNTGGYINCTAFAYWSPATSTDQAPLSGETATRLIRVVYIKITDPSKFTRVSFLNGAIPTSPSIVEFSVDEIHPDMDE